MLKGNNIYLRMLEKNDIRILYELCNEEQVKIYNTIPDNITNNKKSNLRKALSIVNEKNVLVGFITYKENNYANKVYSIGITISSQYWGRKYGQDSIRTLLKYLFEEQSAIGVELEVIKSNLRAIACYKICGFIEVAIKANKVCIKGEYVDIIIMRILKEETIRI